MGQPTPGRAGGHAGRGAPAPGRKPGRQRVHSLPASYAKQVLEIAIDRGADPARLLAGTGLTPELLDTPDLRISTADGARVVFNAFECTGDHGLGLEFGLRMKPTAHGYVGIAAMSAGTLREALELGIRYVHLRQRDAGFQLSVQGDQLVLEARERHDLGPLRRFILEALMVGFFNMGRILLGEPRPEGELWFDWPEPDYFEGFRERLPRVRFSMPSVQVRLPTHYLERRLILADTGSVRRAVEECERERALGDPSPDNLLERVRARLVLGPRGFPDQESVAAGLFMSPRTLKRKLHERGYSFRELLDGVRFREARRLLENPELDISQVALSLGYSDPACFTRAFRRWSGRTPSQARAEQRLLASAREPQASSSGSPETRARW